MEGVDVLFKVKLHILFWHDTVSSFKAHCLLREADGDTAKKGQQ